VGALRQSTKDGRLPVLDYVLRAQDRRRRLRCGGLAAIALLPVVLAVVVGLALSPGRQPITGLARTGAVTGYIQPCDGLGVPLHTSTGARLFSAAALVEALPGQQHSETAADGTYWVVLPTVVAAWERVSQNQEFRLDHLAPGRYVILAEYTGGNASTLLDVLVAAGRVAEVDLPNTCI
jgi:hypothetical protein